LYHISKNREGKNKIDKYFFYLGEIRRYKIDEYAVVYNF
jgi:hypothetical protein